MTVLQTDWGDVATWVTGFFTAGPLFVALYILSRDSRQQRERQAQSVVAYQQWGQSGVTLHIWNLSDKPIFELEYESRGVTPGGEVQFFLEPNGRATATLDPIDDSSASFKAALFRDAIGQPWHLDIRGNKNKLGPQKLPSNMRMAKWWRRVRGDEGVGAE